MENEFNLSEAADEIFGNESDAVSTNEEVDTEGQSLEGNPEQAEVQSEVSPKDILAKVGEPQKTEVDQVLLEKVNGLGLIHNGLPIKIDTPDLLKEMLQKGFDYTKKTMAHADEVRAKTEEFTTKEAQLNERISQFEQKEQEFTEQNTNYQLMIDLLRGWKSQDPELFEYIDQAFSNAQRSYQSQMPMLQQYEGKFKELNNKLSALEKGEKDKELNSIRSSWEEDLSETQGRVASNLQKLGVKVDWEKVKTAWSADVNGNLSVEDALYASHGKEIVKANESYQKMLETKNKTNSAMLARGGGTGGTGSKVETKKVRTGDYESILAGAFD